MISLGVPLWSTPWIKALAMFPPPMKARPEGVGAEDVLEEDIYKRVKQIKGIEKNQTNTDGFDDKGGNFQVLWRK
jgi:hypothetical protein